MGRHRSLSSSELSRGLEVRERALHGPDALAEVGVVEELGIRELNPMSEKSGGTRNS